MRRYTLDPGRISLDRFMQLTRDRKMLPSRIALQHKMDQRFNAIRNTGITQLGELLSLLGTRAKLEAFSLKSGLTVDYLVLLKREAGSYLSRPFPLANFPGIPFEFTESLKTKDLVNTRDFFEKVQTNDQQASLSRQTGIPVARLKELYALCDLSRITGVGGVFARVVYEAGIRSSSEFAKTRAAEYYRKYMAHIKRHNYAAGHFSEGDIQYCIDYARVVVEADNYKDP